MSDKVKISPNNVNFLIYCTPLLLLNHFYISICKIAFGMWLSGVGEIANIKYCMIFRSVFLCITLVVLTVIFHHRYVDKLSLITLVVVGQSYMCNDVITDVTFVFRCCWTCWSLAWILNKLWTHQDFMHSMTKKVCLPDPSPQHTPTVTNSSTSSQNTLWCVLPRVRHTD